MITASTSRISSESHDTIVPGITHPLSSTNFKSACITMGGHSISEVDELWQTLKRSRET